MPARQLTLNDANPVRTLGSPALQGKLGTYIVHVTAIDGTLVFRGRLNGSGVEPTDCPTLAYDNMSLGYTLTDPITAVGLYRVPVDNLDFIVHRTAGTSVQMYIQALEEG